jgi:carbon-monoxide dehydrogenase large subunit
MTPGLQASECFTAPFVFAAGAYLAAVEVDPETGRLIVADIVAVDDVGRVVNPLLAEGQVLGGSAQGLGQVVGEEVVHDEAGQVLTGSLADYGIPTAADVAPVHAEFVETPSPLNPLGAKGVGEGGAIGVPAAVANALAPLGIRHVDPPYTPEVLWRLVAGAGGGAR